MSRFTLMENLPDLLIASTTTVTMASSYLGKPTRISVGGFQNLYISLTTLNFATTGLNALDTGTITLNTLYYIYAVKSSGGVAGLVASTAAPSVGPSGYTAWREIGRCRTLSSAATLATITNRVGGTSSLTLGGSEWVTFTPSAYQGFGTTSNVNLERRRFGSSLQIQGRFLTGTNTAVEGRVQLPPDLTIRTPGSVTIPVGMTSADVGATNFPVILAENGMQYVTFGRLYIASTLYSKLNGNDLTVNNSLVAFNNVSIPIAEWAGLYT